MSLIKQRPRTTLSGPFTGLDIFDRFIEPFGRSPFGGIATRCGDSESAIFMPAVDIIQQEDAIVLKADLPGVKREDVEVTIHEGTLTLKGTKDTAVEKNEEGIHHLERSRGDFNRIFRLPELVVADKVKAEFKDGVLEIRLPLTEKIKPRRVAIDDN